MKIGTKSVLYGYHCFLIHWFFVAWGWTRLYGWTWDPRIWIAFFVHDLGYVGKPNMDGADGEQHPILGANIMSWLFDWPRREYVNVPEHGLVRLRQKMLSHGYEFDEMDSHRDAIFYKRKWYWFTLCHSRYMAAREGMKPSRLCYADKLAISLYPPRLFLWLARATGEIREYKRGKRGPEGEETDFGGMIRVEGEDMDWVLQVQEHSRQFVADNVTLSDAV